MKVNDTNLNSLSSTGTTGTQGPARTGQVSGSSSGQTPATGSSSDDVHLSELVKSLRSLAAESPERQAKLESLARSYASGSYSVDPSATASKIIDDATGK
jgi:flagellar biosynthesis anti-sigma factor FlgM